MFSHWLQKFFDTSGDKDIEFDFLKFLSQHAAYMFFRRESGAFRILQKSGYEQDSFHYSFLKEKPEILKSLLKKGYLELLPEFASKAGYKPWVVVDRLKGPNYLLIAEIPEDVSEIGLLLCFILNRHIQSIGLASGAEVPASTSQKHILQFNSPKANMIHIRGSPKNAEAPAEPVKNLNLPHWVRELLPDMLARASPILVVAESGSGKEELVQAFLKEKYGGLDSAIFFHPGRLSQAVQLRELFGDSAGVRLGGAGSCVPIVKRPEPVVVIQEAADLDAVVQLRLFAYFSSSSADTDKKKWIFETSRDLPQMVTANRFLEGLCNILWDNALTITPLRLCLDCLDVEVDRLLAAFRTKYRRNVTLDESAISALMNYNWPGNWRELCNTLESAFLMVTDGAISSVDLHLGRWSTPEDWDDLNLRKHSQSLEKSLLLRAYALHAGNQVHMARALGISRGSLQYKLDKHNLN